MEGAAEFSWDQAKVDVAVEAVSAFLGMIGALLVALVVYLLTVKDQKALYQKSITDRENEERARRGELRRVVSHEIEGNLKALGRFWPEMLAPDSGGQPPTADRIAKRLVGSPVPDWSTWAWAEFVPYSAVEFTHEQRSEVQEVYSVLAAITRMQERLQAAQQADVMEYAGQPETPGQFANLPGHKWSVTYRFDYAASHVEALSERVEKLLQRGNPVPVATTAMAYESVLCG